MMRRLLPFALVALGPVALQAQAPAPPVSESRAARVVPSVSAIRVQSPPQIDGRLDDAVWAQAPVINTFTQRDPQEGAAASERTEVRIAYDDEAIYIAARLLD